MIVKIWGVVEGPIGIDEVDPSELDQAPVDSKYFMVCKTENLLCLTWVIPISITRSF
jgi:hypothetical protein